jgi:hypothetical protein
MRVYVCACACVCARVCVYVVDGDGTTYWLMTIQDIAVCVYSNTWTRCGKADDLST